MGGGTNTNKNGLSYEQLTKLSQYIDPVVTGSEPFLKFVINDIEFIWVTKAGLRKFLKEDLNKECEKYLEPDEALIDMTGRRLFILEKKFQTCSGSVDEKIQTGLFKYEYYCEQYPGYSVKYAYVLSDWFKHKRYKPEMRFLQKYNISVFWASSEDYFDHIRDWLL